MCVGRQLRGRRGRSGWREQVRKPPPPGGGAAGLCRCGGLWGRQPGRGREPAGCCSTLAGRACWSTCPRRGELPLNWLLCLNLSSAPRPQPGVALDSPGLHAGGGVKGATPPGAGRGLGRHAHRWLGRVVVCVGGPPSLPLVLGGGASAPHRGNPFPPTHIIGLHHPGPRPDSVGAARVPQDGYWWGCGEPCAPE